MKTTYIAFFISIMALKHISAQKPFIDHFQEPKSLSNWKTLEIEGWTSKIRKLEVKDGNLIFEPTSSGWFEDNYAGLIYRTYSGNFELTAKMKVEGVSSKLPNTTFSLAGLFVRAPRELDPKTWQRNRENWIFFSIGSATAPGQPQFEIKTTYNSQSTLKIYPAKSNWVTLKIVRISEIFTLLYQFEGEEWKILDHFIRPDLPDTLQIGITAYSDWPSVSKIYPNFEEYNKNGTKKDGGDLRAYFDYISIEPGKLTKELPIANFISQQVLNDLKERKNKP